MPVSSLVAIGLSAEYSRGSAGKWRFSALKEIVNTPAGFVTRFMVQSAYVPILRAFTLRRQHKATDMNTDMNYDPTRLNSALAVLALAGSSLLLAPGNDARADSGLYLGGSIGSSTLQADIPDEDLGNVFQFDENDFAWKAFGGFNFDLPLVQLGIEGGYVDLGGPSASLLSESIELKVNGWDAFGVLGFDFGPLGVFGKVGAISWDIESTISGIEAGTDDGTDPAYGIGARFGLGSIQIRGEYEYFDIDSASDLYMLSVGVVWTF